MSFENGYGLRIKGSKGPRPQGLEMYTEMVERYYQGLNRPMSTAGKLYANPDVVNIDSDPHRALSSIVQLVKRPVTRILTVVGGEAPEWFRSIYPDADISAFDINPSQLGKCFQNQTADLSNVFVSDIAIPGELSRLVCWTRPQILFISNIFDYLTADEQFGLASEISTNCSNANILMTQLNPGLDIPSAIVMSQGNLWECFPPNQFMHEFEVDWNSGKTAHLLLSLN